MKLPFPPSALLAPLPAVMVSCGDISAPNIITVAWTGIISSSPPRLYISVRKERFSYGIILEDGQFVVNLVPASLTEAADLCGVRTGNTAFSTSARGKNINGKRYDKFAACHLTAAPSLHVTPPSIAECPVSIECRTFNVLPLGSHDMFMADIAGITVDERLFDESGGLHMERANLMAYAHGDYFALGERLGHMGFSVKKKK